MRGLKLLLIVLVIAVLVGVWSRDTAAADFKTGDMVDKDSWQKAEALLPPEVLRHYKDGEYANKFIDWPMAKTVFPPDFKAASDANEGKFTTSADGTILDKATGKQPPYVFGVPFPTIDAKDPAAAVKIVWDHFYRSWYYGNIVAQSQVNWVSPTGLERRADVKAAFGYYDGVPQDELPGANPDNFLYRQLALVTGPADLNGTAALTWRYRDPGKRDSTWAYVPALRRVRATSPANRSDGFLGSDVSQDDGQFFDGKVEDFSWTLVGQTDQLRLSEETNLKGQAKAVWVEGKGWDTEWPDLPFIGYMDPSWKGIAWAPTAAASLSLRRHWIVEGVPRDTYYLFGKIQLYIDTVSYQGAWNRKFGWKGDLLAIHQVMAWNPMPFTRPDGKVDYNQGSNQAYQTVENVKMNRATVAGIKSSPTAGFYLRGKLDPALYDIDALARSGK
ncbi:MAG TPA: DUF1329 domain-containing protein [Candidatus Eisenbacteria bacterium]|nr:DUF1329 domain-containing protein [Candidatus Eisenbacteria bacterium]